MRLIPDSLAGRTIIILVVGLGLFHLWSIWIYQIGTENLLGPGRERALAEHLLAVSRALDGLPQDQRAAAVPAQSAPDMPVSWSLAAPKDGGHADDTRLAALRKALRKLDPELDDARIRLGSAGNGDAHHGAQQAALQLRDGSWVAIGISTTPGGEAVEHDVLGSLTAMALGILIVSILLVRSLTAPLRALAGAAERIGTDIAATGAPETGPREIRLVAHAFNTMQSRIRRLITDRTQTLAAVSHDLKTPLTRLRLRAAFVPDGELRAMIEADLDEMERMLDSTLAFLRGETAQEERRTIDISSMLQTICNHATDAGADVVLSGSPRAPLHCRPLAIKRALSNLLDNAIKYGGRARVTLHDAERELIVTIEDDGAGIPADERERVFDPFYRIESSRSRDTGGTGLGLTVARTAIRAHGGDIILQSGAAGGLRAVVTLPKTAH